MDIGETAAAPAQAITSAIMNGGDTLVHRMNTLVIQLAVIIFAVRAGGWLIRRFKLPGVLGELISGIIIGPFMLGGIPLPWIGFPDGLFAKAAGTMPISTELYGFATVASLILLFMVGLETDFRQFLKYSVAGTIIGLGGVVVSFAVGDLAGCFFSHVAHGDKTHFLHPTNLFLGALCTATSVGITARILSERKQMDSPEGVTILASAIIDDVLGIIVLGIVISFIDMAMISGGNISGLPWGDIIRVSAETILICMALSALGITCSSHIGRFLKSFKNPNTFATLALGMAFLMAGIFESAGLAMIIGAYVMGLSLSKTDITFVVQERLHNLHNFFVPIFFAVMGMILDLNRLAKSEVIRFGLIFGMLAVVAKIVGCAAPALFLHFNWLGALRIGIGMIPRGEVALIISGIGVSTGILDPDMFGVAIIMTLFTTIIAPPLLTIMLSIPGRGVTMEQLTDGFRQSEFPFPSEAVADGAAQSVISEFQADGFFISMVDSDARLYHIRKDDLAFSMWRDDNHAIVFSSSSKDITLIYTVVYEALVEMHQELDRLKELAKPREYRRTLSSITSVRTLSMREKREILIPESVVMNMASRTKDEAIRELVRHLDGGSLPMRSEGEVIASIAARESADPTELEFGVFMPHGRTDAVSGVMASVGICPQGMDFASLDGTPVKLIVLVVSPKNTTGPHLYFLASLTSSLRTKEMVEQVIRAESPAEVVRLLIGKKNTSIMERLILGGENRPPGPAGH
ncbi:MAG: cation:proton antiporter [Planctomycetota bacterium]|jgi:Kef-type K+ transport system membrane component KefB/mannitol/fructose-specific phosphotransferase system IIA component (Ntr-type)|nr:cation:proton antiporter [Planctomycetota bacterium]